MMMGNNASICFRTFYMVVCSRVCLLKARLGTGSIT